MELPLIRVMALHAMAYCPRLFYLEEVEEIRVADDRVFAGRELHEGLENEDEAWDSLPLDCPALGLTGKVDCVRRRDGARVPYEHKRGRCRRGENDEPQAWQSDFIQVAAYGMMLEEALGQPVPEGRVRYHQDNVTVRVPLDEGARQAVREAIDAARRLRESVDRPPVADNEHLCVRCSLAPVCLPEEVRQADDPGHEPVRLFPERRDRTSLHVVSPGTSIGRSGDTFVLRPLDGEPTKHPAHEIQAILLHGYAQISSQAVRLCADQDIAGLTTGPGQVQRRLRQYQALTDEGTCLRLAKALALAKVEGQLRYLLRASRQDEPLRQQLDSTLHRIRRTAEAIAHAPDRGVLRGHEGEAARDYFGSLNLLFSASVPEELRYDKRTRQPPLDRFSAALGFGYALLQSAVMRAILAAGLEPAIGFFHTPRSAAHPLVLDLMELFRVPLWDMVLVASLNRGQWEAERDFSVTKAKVWLSDAGRKKAIGLFENRLQETWKHPVVNYSLSYDRTIELEARLLEKEWTGEPGLFARMRLR
jgi:CRISP-associated protein Cas1